MKIVYIAGPYGDAGGYLSIDRNIAQAREIAAMLAEARIGYICPHLNAAHMEAIVPGVPVDFWYELDEELLRRADGIVLLPGWRDSNGTKREIAIARSLGLPFFYMDEIEIDAQTYRKLFAWAKGPTL